MLQVLSPEWTPAYAGFSPRPAPRLIAWKLTHGSALAISKGLDRDRAVDESGNQVSVFNRIGARPMTLPEMQRLYLHNGMPYNSGGYAVRANLPLEADARWASES